ncbi:hypothetical protein, partial [Arthrobacter sp. CAN_A214]|uniref:hypothetical protein n=1 Tax=Arthrobacter sp. CAN_A214 TaxID=2787720 RepID=UPI002FF42258
MPWHGLRHAHGRTIRWVLTEKSRNLTRLLHTTAVAEDWEAGRNEAIDAQSKASWVEGPLLIFEPGC